VLQSHYGVPTISRLLKIIGLFCRISSFAGGLFCRISSFAGGHVYTSSMSASLCFMYMYIYVYIHICRNIYTCSYRYMETCVYLVDEVYRLRYGVATISRLLKIIGLFCRI